MDTEFENDEKRNTAHSILIVLLESSLLSYLKCLIQKAYPASKSFLLENKGGLISKYPPELKSPKKCQISSYSAQGRFIGNLSQSKKNFLTLSHLYLLSWA